MSTRLPIHVEAELYELVRRAPAYAPAQRLVLADAWRRPVELDALAWPELVAPLQLASLSASRSLSLARLLYNIYEQNGLYLPDAALSSEAWAAFESYYDSGLIAAGAALRPALEHASFAWLDTDIEVSGPWDIDAFEAHVGEALRAYEAASSEVCETIAAAAHPREALRAWLIQVAPDFISEASQMARALPGNFGPAQSELTKIFIDEFGYGVHRTKHSTLFEACLASVGLAAMPHAYYGWYLPTSLHMANYFHWVTANKPRWFEYLGALYWIEAVVPHFNRQFARLLTAHFGPSVDREYFDEHVGIDIHHRRQVLHDLIRPAVARHGRAIVPAILRGVEAARRFGELADHDFLAQLAFCEQLAAFPREVEPDAWPEPLAGPRVFDRPQLLEVEAGAVIVEGGYFAANRLDAGARLEIPAGRLVALRPARAARHRLEATP